jgi:membrane-associated phospholipid phosphatase
LDKEGTAYFRFRTGLTLLLVSAGCQTPMLQAQDAALNNNQATTQSTTTDQQYERPVSWKLLPTNVLDDQKHIYSFPARLEKKRVWIPTALILGATAGLIVLDSHDAPYFRKTSTFNGFNNVFSGTATAVGTGLVPAGLYAVGLLHSDSKMKQTALLAGEAVADTEILATILKESTRRIRPASKPPNSNFADTFYEGAGTSFPSGHSIVAFGVATVVARRYGNHKWVPYVSYGAAALVAFSRVTLSAHYVSDVFLGAALGYSVGRFAVLRQ